MAATIEIELKEHGWTDGDIEASARPSPEPPLKVEPTLMEMTADIGTRIGAQPWWVACSVLVNLLFGMLPVFARYLTGPPIWRLEALGAHPRWAVAPAAGLSLAAVSQAIAGGLVLFQHVITSSFSTVQHRQSYAQRQPLVATAMLVGATTAPSAPSKTTKADDAGGSMRKGLRHHPKLALRYGALMSLSCTCVLAPEFTEAYNVQLVGMLAPFVTALVSRALLGERLSRALWPTLALCAVGTLLVLLQEAEVLGDGADTASSSNDDDAASNGEGVDGEGEGADGEAGGSALGGRDLLGMGLMLFSITMQAFTRVEMRRSAGRLSTRELLLTQVISCVI